MITRPGDRLAGGRLSRRLMLVGLSLWGASLTGALAPRVLHALLYPNHAEASPFVLVAALPVGAPLLWTALLAWSLSWAFVAGHLSSEWAARRGRPSWALPALLLASLASPLVFGLAVSALLRLATHGAYHAGGVIPFLPALAAQLVVSQAYSFLTGPSPRAGLARAEGA